MLPKMISPQRPIQTMRWPLFQRDQMLEYFPHKLPKTVFHKVEKGKTRVNTT